MPIILEDLDFQQQAIDAVIHVLDGQIRNTFERANLLGIYRNVVELSPDKLLENKRKVIATNGIPEEQAKLCEDPDYCIEMETGTGKTIVYLRTIYELHRAYKLTKFVILVPSVPIREGVLATFRDFEGALRDRYGFAFTPFEYASKDVSKLRGFIEDPHPQVMIMTMQSFNTDENILNRPDRDDALGDHTFLEALGKCRPIIIMDEPQEGMDTENAIARIATLQPAAKLRYSATHKVVKNLLYRLTPADAYRQNLVKKIEVLSVIEQNDEATLKLEFAQYQPGRNSAPPKAKLNAWCNTASGSGGGIKWKTTKWLKGPAASRPGDNLEAVTKNVSYRGYVIERIWKDLDDGQTRVRFTNGVELIEGKRDGDRAGLFRLQLEYLIRRHNEKKAKLLPAGIKPLSLIFIDKVANFLSDDPEHPPIIKQLFEELYAAAYLKQHGKAPTADQIQAVQGYYFAAMKSGKSKGEYTDNAKSMQKDKAMFEEILRDKSALLDHDNPREFIFTHSALGVGWDNPNVFNIATLNNAYDENRKRQEIGRGLRICRHTDGHRVYDALDVTEGEETNLLTIVPNESYETFATQYQQQIIDDYGSAGAGSPLRKIVKGKPKKTTLTRREDLFASDAFRAFWDKLAKKTDYTVAFDEAALIDRAIKALDTLRPAKYRALVTSTRLTIDDEDKVGGADGGSAVKELRAIFAPLDIVEELSESTGLAYPTVFQIIEGMANHKAIAANPASFLTDAAEKLRHAESEELLRTLSYKPTGEALPLADLKKTLDTFLETTATTTRGLYDAVIHDSTYEQAFARAADTDTEVLCFLKLPKSYRIPIPFGVGGKRTYNPDFGLVLKRKGLDEGGEQDYYFVIETKSTNNIDDTRSLTEDERLKIKCAIKHFEALGIEAKLDYAPYIAPVADYQKDFKAKVPH